MAFIKSRKRKRKVVKRKTTVKRRKVFKKKKAKFQGKKKSRVLGSKHGPLHRQWKQAYKIAKRVWPFPKSLIKGAKTQTSSKLEIQHGDPNHQKKVVTKLITFERFTTGHATNTGVNIAMDMSNVNDPLGSFGNNAPKYSDSWRALGMDIYTPLGATYKVTVGKLRDSVEGVSMLQFSNVDQTSGAVTWDTNATHVSGTLRKWYIFWRVVGQDQDPPVMLVPGEPARKLVEDMLASMHWNHRSMLDNHGKYGQIKFTVTIPNIPAWIARNNGTAPAAAAYGGALVDGTTAIGAAERPTLQLTIISEDGSVLIDANAFALTIEASHTVLLEDADFVGAIRPMPINDD